VIVVNVRSGRPYEAARGFAVQRTIVDRLKRLPGIRSASAANVLPIGGGLWTRGVQVEGYTFRADESDRAVVRRPRSKHVVRTGAERSQRCRHGVVDSRTDRTNGRLASGSPRLTG